MENEPLFQLLCCGQTFVWGVLTGVWYEVLGFLRMLDRFWLTALCDGLFWVTAAVATFLFFLHLNGGAPRGFLWLSMAMGMAVVHWMAKRLLDDLKKRVAEGVQTAKRRRRIVRREKNT